MKDAKFKSKISRFRYKDGRIGGAFINVPKKSLELLEPSEDKQFLVIIQEIEEEINLTHDVKGYKCRVCEHRFYNNDEIPFCPSCGEEGDSLEEIYD